MKIPPFYFTVSFSKIISHYLNRNYTNILSKVYLTSFVIRIVIIYLKRAKKLNLYHPVGPVPQGHFQGNVGADTVFFSEGH